MPRRRRIPPRRKRTTNARTSRRSRFYRNRVRSGTNRRFARLYRNPLAADRQNAVLVYNTNISLDPKPDNLGATGSNTWQFSGNSLYDPDVTSTGHQPMFFDNFMAVYNRYRVNYSQITVTVVNHSVNTAAYNGTSIVTTPNYSYKLFILKDVTNSASDFPGTMEAMIEAGSKDVSWRFVGPSLTGKLPKLFSSMSPHHMAMKSFRDDTLAGTYGASPAQYASYFVGITSADGATDPPSVYLNVRIKYFCEFFDRKAAQSQN